MKYLIHGCWRDEPREYLANKIGEDLYIYVAGGWRPGIWVDDNGEGLHGYKCLYTVQRWQPPYLFIRVRSVEFIGEGIWKIYRNKIGGYSAWIDREKLCYQEVNRNKLKGWRAIHLNGSERFKGMGDILIYINDRAVCAIDVVGSCYHKRFNKYQIQTEHKDVIGWVGDMHKQNLIPVYAFLLNGALLPKKFNYMVLSEEVIKKFFTTRKGTIKKGHVDFTKTNLWGDRRVPSTPRGWYNLNNNFLTIAGLKRFIVGGVNR